MIYDDWKKDYEIGMPIFIKFFNMPKTELLEVLKEICGDLVCEDVLEPSSTVYKELVNDEPKSLKVCSWDTLEISPFGINLKKEHGEIVQIVKFNKFFNI